MYRFDTIGEYDRRLDQLSREIQWLKRNKCECQHIIDCERLKLSYIIEKKEFLDEILDKHSC